MKNKVIILFFIFIFTISFNMCLLHAEGTEQVEPNQNEIVDSESSEKDILEDENPSLEETKTTNIGEVDEVNEVNEVDEVTTLRSENDNQSNDLPSEPTDNVLNNPTTGLGAENSNNEENESTSKFVAQKAKVIISKKNRDEEFVIGALLQLFDSEGNLIEEWVSENGTHEIMLPNGKYTLHEEITPDGYIKADDQIVEVKIEVPEVEAGVIFDTEFCEHHHGIPLYYVDIEGRKEEVYCINQEWEVPDGESDYDGAILDKDRVREYTRQTVPIAADGTKEKIDISVPEDELDNKALYDKILDIIYHRHQAETKFNDIALPELVYLTEAALKNYTNAGLTEVALAYRKRNNTTFVPLDDPNVSYDERSNGDIYYLRHQYRDFVYTPDAPMGQNIYEIDFGKGNSFGQLVAYHWSAGHHAGTDPAVRQRVARYYEVYNYLIGDDDNDNVPDHPSDMNLYIYSSDTTYTGSNPNADYAYQNLLGITGYFESNEGKEQKVVMYDEYSDEKREVSVEKEWNDKDNYNNSRPNSIIVNLEADGQVIARAELNEENEWKHTFKELEVYNKGKLIEYKVNEVKVPKYESEIEGDMVEGFTITNTYYEGKNPPTDDKIILYVIFLLMNIFGIYKFTTIYNRI